MSEAVIHKSLETAYANIEAAIVNAKKAAFEYEVFISDSDQRSGNAIKTGDPKSYFSNLLKRHEGNSDN